MSDPFQGVLSCADVPDLRCFNCSTVIVVIALLFALLLPALQKVREAAERMSSINNLKQMVLATHNYNDANGLLPPGVDDNNFSASAKLLPYIEQGNLYNSINFDKPITADANAAAQRSSLRRFSVRDPITRVRDESGATNYLFNDQVFFLNSKSSIPKSFPDGTSNTIAIGETLKGDNGDKAEDVRRQYVLLKKRFSERSDGGHGRALLEGE